MGERAILQLREKEKARLGPDFDIRVFHRRLLPCKGPIDELENCFNLQKTEGEKEASSKATAVHQGALAKLMPTSILIPFVIPY